MRRATHFLPPRQSVVYGYTRRMLDETATNANSFAMAVAEHYLATVAPDVRTVPFKLGEGDALIASLKANGQTLRRYMDGTVKALPADLEDAWITALPEPYRSDCERDLARRRGRYSVALPESLSVAEFASMAKVMQEAGELCAAWGQALGDGRLCDADHHQINDRGDDVIAAVLSLRRYMSLRRHEEAGGDG